MICILFQKKLNNIPLQWYMTCLHSVILTFINAIEIDIFNTETSQNGVGKLGLREQTAHSECIQK